MKERPILFSAPMVRAIMKSQKTQTRRIIKQQPPEDAMLFDYHDEDSSAIDYRGKWGWFEPEAGDLWPCGGEKAIKCPYGVNGDHLWVKETFEVLSVGKGVAHIKYKADGNCHFIRMGNTFFKNLGVKPSIFMPRWVSRMKLEVINIRIEKLQAITDGDVAKEGCEWSSTRIGSDYGSPARDAFAKLWDSINAKPKPVYGRDEDGKKVITHYKSYPWKALRTTREYRHKPWIITGNPWVWIVEFRRNGS